MINNYVRRWSFISIKNEKLNLKLTNWDHFLLCTLTFLTTFCCVFFNSVYCVLSESNESDVLAAFHAEQISYLEKKKAAQKRKGEGRDEQVIDLFQ